MAFVKDIAISGEELEHMKNKHFVIIENPKYVTFQPNEEKDEEERLVLRIELLENGSQVDYFPNRTSIKTLTSLAGRNMDKWVGKKFEFFTNKQKAFGKDLVVIYVADKKD